MHDVAVLVDWRLDTVLVSSLARLLLVTMCLNTTFTTIHSMPHQLHLILLRSMDRTQAVHSTAMMDTMDNRLVLNYSSQQVHITPSEVARKFTVHHQDHHQRSIAMASSDNLPDLPY
jgi:hypothetical protein